MVSRAEAWRHGDWLKRHWCYIPLPYPLVDVVASLGWVEADETMERRLFDSGDRARGVGMAHPHDGVDRTYERAVTA